MAFMASLSHFSTSLGAAFVSKTGLQILGSAQRHSLRTANHLRRHLGSQVLQAEQGTGSGKDHKRAVVFIRHGQSDFNKYEIFTGWCDVDVNKIGEAECRRAGMLLASMGFEFDLAYTSVLKRATKSTFALLDGCDQTFVPIKMHWKLNERHYGALQGLSKEESERRMGPIVREWRRSWDVPPPDMDSSHPHWGIITNDRRYRGVENLPRGESLEMCSVRVKAYWDEAIVPDIKAGKRLVVVAHANSLRSLFKKLDDMSEDNIRALKVDNGQPIVYFFDQDMNVLGTPNEIGFRGLFLREDAALQQHLDQATLLQQELQTGAAADDLDETSPPLNMGREMMSKLSGPSDTRSGRTSQ